MAITPEIKLEKKIDAKLDSTEKASLEKLTSENFKDQLQKLKDEKFDLSNKNKWVKLEDVVKNYNTSTGTIDINWEKIPVWKWTDLAAWIQVLMVADERDIKTNKDLSKRWIDGKIWAKTTSAIDDYKDFNKTNVWNTNNLQPKNNVEFPDTLTFKDIEAIKNGLSRLEFESTLWANIITFMKNSNILTSQNQLNSLMYSIDNKSPYMIKFTVNNDRIKNKVYTIPLTSLLNPRSKNASTWDLIDDPESTIFSKFKEVVKDNNTAIDAEKLLNNKKALEKSIENWAEDVKVSSFNQLMQEYLTNQGRVSSWKIDFKSGFWSGMEVKWDRLVISMTTKDKETITVSYLLSGIQKNNEFDSVSFVKELTNWLTSYATKWKREDYSNQYNELKSSTSTLTSNLSTDYIANTKSRIADLKKLSDQITVDKNVSWVDLIKEIDTRKSVLEARLSYLEMKQRDETKVSWFEKFLNTATPKTAWEKMKFDNEVNAKKGEYKMFRDNFNDREKTYVHISPTDRSSFDKRLKTIDETYDYNLKK